MERIKSYEDNILRYYTCCCLQMHHKSVNYLELKEIEEARNIMAYRKLIDLYLA